MLMLQQQLTTPPHMLSNIEDSGILGERHSVYARTSIDFALSVDSLWTQLLHPAVDAWENEVSELLNGEWQHISTSIAAVQAQKRSMLAAAASSSSVSRSKALVSLSWALLATVREQAIKQLADMEKVMADKLFAAVLGAAVEHNDALAKCMKQNPKAPMVACQAMRLVNRSVNAKQAWLKQQIEVHSSKVLAVIERSRHELRHSLDGGKEACLKALHAPWWQ